MSNDGQVTRTASSTLPTPYGVFGITVYRSASDDREHAALFLGRPEETPTMVRVHSQCVTGDTFLSLRCDCGEQLRKSMELIAKRGSGVILYLAQEGRGIGLSDKIRAYALQDGGLDTVEANEALGRPADARDYGIAAAILRDLGIGKILLLTNNPDKIKQLTSHGIEIAELRQLTVAPNAHNRAYLETKRNKFGHAIPAI
ncbi:MAG: GTP cyclohydrolase II [Patescibacteria group bacterium]